MDLPVLSTSTHTSASATTSTYGSVSAIGPYPWIHQHYYPTPHHTLVSASATTPKQRSARAMASHPWIFKCYRLNTWIWIRQCKPPPTDGYASAIALRPSISQDYRPTHDFTSASAPHMDPTMLWPHPCIHRWILKFYYLHPWIRHTL
ncbi:hypothetical protein Bpfe_011212 [Biomphalaria pfeifferi]|uniref:Uncharacterized protein n=1 Tax=Biomphalaria pfeifferi TaxID=112525 RepID=A0AAD8BRP3_BIOPF|nr:hypothetical protein Bpfe_011212 [Biomphalaria pfeifferi]